MPTSVPSPDEDILRKLSSIITATRTLLGIDQTPWLSRRRWAWFLELAATRLYLSLGTELPAHYVVVLLGEAAVFCRRGRLPFVETSDEEAAKFADETRLCQGMYHDEQIRMVAWQGHALPMLGFAMHTILHDVERAATLIMSGCTPHLLISAARLLYIKPYPSLYWDVSHVHTMSMLEMAYRLRASTHPQESLSTNMQLQRQGIFACITGSDLAEHQWTRHPLGTFFPFDARPDVWYMYGLFVQLSSPGFVLHPGSPVYKVLLGHTNGADITDRVEPLIAPPPAPLCHVPLHRRLRLLSSVGKAIAAIMPSCLDSCYAYALRLLRSDSL